MKYLKDLKKSNRGDATNKVALVLAILFLVASIVLLIDTGEKTNFSPDKLKVIDGDTVEASFNSSKVTVRLLGVDTPETQMENNPSEFGMADNSETNECLREWGNEATQYAKDFLTENSNVRTDPVSQNYGDYNRLLAYVDTSNGTLNEALVRNGYARVYESDFTELNNYKELEKEAKNKNIGLWICN